MMKNTSLWRPLLLAVLLFGSSMAWAQKKNIVILATGGTIAGVSESSTKTNYQAGQLPIDQLLNAVPAAKEIANLKGEQVARIGSQDMTFEVWLKLANRINELLASPGVDGVVVTHGTDTMEETSYFLNLTVKSDKPVVMVGSMRPATALSAEGPLNLYDAIVTASSDETKGKGVIVCMNGSLLAARGAMKMNTTDVQAFQDPNSGPLGYVNNSKVTYLREPLAKHTTQSVFDVKGLTTLPQVELITSTAYPSPLFAQAVVDTKPAGLVVAGSGNGNISNTILPLIAKAAKQGTAVVRSSRTHSGSTSTDAEINDAEYGFAASLFLQPSKARVLLILALTKTKDIKQIQQYFREY